MEKLPISLCIFVKNEEDNLRDCIESVLPVVSEVIIVDTGSTDKTVEIAKKYTERVYEVGFTDFGNIRTVTAHLANHAWVLMIDADERLDSAEWPKLAVLIDQPLGVAGDDMELDDEGNVIIDSWALPRKRWEDKWRTKQVDVESYPDWQVRLFRNHHNRKKIRYRRRIHETVVGCVRTELAAGGPTIHHFQNVHKDDASLKKRASLYKRLHAADVGEGVEHTEPPVIDKDNK